MYKVHTLKAVRKDLKRLSKQAAARIVSFCLPQLSKNPRLGIPLSENLKGYWKYVFKFQGVNYRIAYQIYEKEKLVLVIAIGPREKFYERLLKRIGFK